jgi:hypothetical protein
VASIGCGVFQDALPGQFWIVQDGIVPGCAEARLHANVPVWVAARGWNVVPGQIVPGGVAPDAIVPVRLAQDGIVPVWAVVVGIVQVAIARV